ncbi:MAG: hypothetical protein HYU66_25960, partial [Armatimonadetes bacterium]|nr:hypothetical protein [Armatimonadota bacterium]
RRILDRADELAMVVILGLFYFGQDQRLRDEAAVVRGVDNALGGLRDGGWRNLLIEVNNECNVRYDHAILQPARVHELIRRVRERGCLAGTSYGGGTVPGDNVLEASDFVLLHGNGVKGPDAIRAQIDATRAKPGYCGQPLLYNEDDHFDFDQPDNHFTAALSRHCGWGYFDYRMRDEGYAEGYQSVPVDWGIGSERKRGFFRMLAEVSGSPG